MCLVSTVFSGLSALVIEDVEDAGEVIWVRAKTPDQAVAYPACGTATARVHGYQERTAADVPVDACRVLVRVRRMGRRPRWWSPRQSALACATNRRKFRSDPVNPAARAAGSSRFAEIRPAVFSTRSATSPVTPS